MNFEKDENDTEQKNFLAYKNLGDQMAFLALGLDNNETSSKGFKDDNKGKTKYAKGSKPMASMLINAGATVTVCHSKTVSLAKYTRECDILIVSVGKPKLITEDMVSDKTVVIDVGINRLEDGLCGDVDYESVSKKASYITPVPGGVGPMTVAMLGVNVLKAYKKQKELL